MHHTCCWSITLREVWAASWLECDANYCTSFGSCVSTTYFELLEDMCDSWCFHQNCGTALHHTSTESHTKHLICCSRPACMNQAKDKLYNHRHSGGECMHVHVVIQIPDDAHMVAVKPNQEAYFLFVSNSLYLPIKWFPPIFLATLLISHTAQMTVCWIREPSYL